MFSFILKNVIIYLLLIKYPFLKKNIQDILLKKSRQPEPDPTESESNPKPIRIQDIKSEHDSIPNQTEQRFRSDSANIGLPDPRQTLPQIVYVVEKQLPTY